MTGRRCDMRKCQIDIIWRDRRNPLVVDIMYDHTTGERYYDRFHQSEGEYVIETVNNAVLRIPVDAVCFLRVNKPRRLE